MRINFFGGPGTGKSTTASWLFSELKLHNVSVEYVSEYVKFWAYQKRKIHKFDQVYLFGKQMHDEYKYLTHGVKNIVTDSPVLLAAIYAGINGLPNIAKSLEEICFSYDQENASFNIILDRGDKKYIQDGRFQTKEQAQEVDKIITSYVYRNYLEKDILRVNYKDRDTILKEVLKKIE